jgi:hypothetical protein
MGISILAWLSSLDPIWGSRDDNQANMEIPMYSSVIILVLYVAKVFVNLNITNQAFAVNIP